MTTISKTAQAGTMESNDIIIIVSPAESGIEIDLSSSVIYQFGDQIRHVLTETLEEQGIDSIMVSAIDRGALDITVKARLLTALERSGFEIKEGF